MPDYQKAKIYKLWSPSKNLVYYGSTTQAISQRLSGHMREYRQCKKRKGNCNSYLILECEDYKIELVEEYPCNNKQQLLKKEGEYIKNNICINKRVAGRTKKEYHKDNKKIIDERNKIYDKENRENISQRKKQKYYEKKQNNAIYKWLLMTGIIQ